MNSHFEDFLGCKCFNNSVPSYAITICFDTFAPAFLYPVRNIFPSRRLCHYDVHGMFEDDCIDSVVLFSYLFPN